MTPTCSIGAGATGDRHAVLVLRVCELLPADDCDGLILEYSDPSIDVELFTEAA